MKKLVALFMTLMMSFSLASCGQSAASSNASAASSAGTEEKVLKVQGDNLGYPSVYTASTKGRGYLLVSYIFDTLIWKDENGVVPMLADEWNVSSDNKVWTFKLNDKAKFTDGEKVTADDVKFSFDYIKEHPYQWVSVEPVKEVKAIDEHTVQIELKDVYAPFLTDIAGNVPIMPKHIWKNVKEPEKFNTEEAVIGSGPLKLESYDKEAGTYIFTANKDYFLGAPKIDKLILSSSSNAKEDLENGTLDAVNGLKYGEAQQLKKDGKFKVIEGPGFWVGRMYFNFAVDEFNNKELRQAMYYGINRDEYVQKAFNGGADAGNPGHIHPESEWYSSDVKQYQYDPGKAQEILDSLGMKDTDNDGIREYNGKKMSYELLAANDRTKEVELIKNYMQAIGIEIVPKTVEQKTVDSSIKEGKFTLALNGHGSFGGDPVLLHRFVSSSVAGSTPEITTQGGKNWSNAEFDKIYAEQLKEVDKDTRYKEVAQLQNIISEELPTLTLYYKKITFAYDAEKFDGWFFTKDGVALAVPTTHNKLVFINGEWKK